MMEKMISTRKKERTTKTYLHIYVSCVLAVLVDVFYLLTFYEGHIITVIYVLASEI